MYATKQLSLFQNQPEAASRPPPEGGNSGYLVVKGGADDSDGDTWCWGQCGGTRVRELPFPQNRVLNLRYTEHHGESSSTYDDAVVFVPVLDQPLSANRYYAVITKGKHKGLVRTCSKEEDKTTCCFCRCIKDAKPRPFDPADVYQQLEIVPRRGGFTARAVAVDGFPPYLYRQKHWKLYASTPKNFHLGEAPGLNHPLRSRQLLAVDATFPAMTSAAVGKWYCPFFFIKEDGVTPDQQMDRATFYEIVLEQHWETLHGHGQASRRVLVGGSQEARLEASRHGGGDGYVWFRAAGRAGGQRVGVCTSLWNRMRWEEYRGGWVDEDAGGEVFAAASQVLVERFVVKRMDGSAVVAFDFVHVKKVRAKDV